MRRILATITGLVSLLTLATANTEKTIFIAPPPHLIPDASIDNLLLVPLNSQHTTARTWLNATFPTKVSSKGMESWMLLEGLSPAMRYELRVCWLATQPTTFELHTYTMEEAFEDPDLLSSLIVFSKARRDTLNDSQIQQLQDRKHRPLSSAEGVDQALLFLRISAAADYYSLNTSLMEQVPPVFVDVILDQYVFGIFPKSLVPTAGYIVTLAVGSWFLSGFLWRAVNNIVQPEAAAVDEYKKIQ
jgi:hypothetical protein